MAVRITSMILRICGTLALILGIIFWTDIAKGALVPIHMLLGIIVALSLLTLGYFIATAKGGSIGLATAAFVVGIIVIVLGLTQQQLFAQVGVGSVWIIKVVHLILGLLAIGVGEMVAARYKRLKIG